MDACPPALDPRLVAPVALTPRSSGAGRGASLHFPRPGLRRGPRRFLLDGVTMLAGRVLLDDEQLAAALPDDAGTLTWDALARWWSEHCTNTSVLYVADDDAHEVAVLPDPLGAAVVFLHDDARVQAASSDVPSLARVVRSTGGRVDVDLDHQVQRVVLGLGGYDVSPVAQARPLEARRWALVTETGIRTAEYAVFAELAGRSYDEVLERTADELRGSLGSLTSLPDVPVVAHLTGGFDSRMVLAAALSAGVQDRLHFFCSGPDGTADRIIADGLTQLFGLRRSATDANVGVGFGTQAERQLAAMIASGGMSPHAPTGFETPQEAVAIGGGYGEMLRPTTGFAGLDAGASPMDVLLRAVPRFDEATSWVRGRTLARVAEEVGRSWRRSAEASRHLDGAGDRFWLDTRARFHFGVNALAVSRRTPRFDPLYSVGAAALVDTVPAADRADNVVGFDLLRLLEPRLLTVPFESYDRFGPAVHERRAVPAVKALPAWRAPELRPLPLTRPTGRPVLATAAALLEGVDLSAPSPEERRAHVARANELHLPYWRIASLEQTQAVMRRALEVLDLRVLDADVDVSAMTRLTRRRLATRTDIRAVHELFSLIAWVAHVETHPLGTE